MRHTVPAPGRATTAHRRSRTAALLLALATPFAVTACGDDVGEKAAEEALEEAGGGDVEVDVDADTGEVVVSDSTGTYTSGGDLPDSFPDDVPIVDGEIVSAMSGGEAGETGHVVMVQTGIEDAAAALDEAVGLLTDAGFASGTQSVQVEGMASQDLTRDALHVVVAAYGSDDGTGAVVQYVVEMGG